MSAASEMSTTDLPSPSQSAEIIEIDGSYGEGGGQLIRNACTYASILRLKLHLTRIREGRRPKAGLQRQHLTGMDMLSAACGGSVASSIDGDGDVAVGSSEVFFMPDNNRQQQQQPDTTASTTRKRKRREITGDTQTAGSICLLLQAVLPFGIFSGSGTQHNGADEIRFILKGGTNAQMAPQFDYFQHVFLPTIKRCCKIPQECIQINLMTRGFYPRGGGHVEVTVRSPVSIFNNPSWKLSPIRLADRGHVVDITIRAFTAGKCHKSMGKKLAAEVKTFLTDHIDQAANTLQQLPTINTHVEHYSDAVGSGCGVLIVATTSTFCLLGGSAIGSPKTPLEKTAHHAARELVEAINGGGCVDDFLQDQLVIYMALAEGVSEIKTNCLTMHTQTAIWLAEKLCRNVHFEVTPLMHQRGGNGDGIREYDLAATRNRGENHREGKIPGLHLIRCRGIGYSSRENTET